MVGAAAEADRLVGSPALPIQPSAPAFLSWAQRTSGTGAYQLPALTVDSSAGLVIEAFGLDLATVGTVQTLTATTVANGGSEAARTYRFAIPPRRRSDAARVRLRRLRRGNPRRPRARPGWARPVGFVDYAAHEANGGLHETIWTVAGARGSKASPEFIGARAHEFRVELDGPPRSRHIAALVDSSGDRRARHEVRETGSASEGSPARGARPNGGAPPAANHYP